MRATRLIQVVLSALAATMVAACTHTASVLPDGRVLLTGGGTAALYDPSTVAIDQTGPPAAVRQGATATVLLDGRVLVAGGRGAEAVLASTELYDPRTGSFSLADDLATARYLHSATRLRDGRVLVIGGAGDSLYGPDGEETVSVLDSAEVYDPATGHWTFGSVLARGRVGHTATLLSDGRVVVLGGGGPDDGRVAVAEVYDPATGRFVTSGSLSTARAFHTATLLSEGRVLVAGGEGEDVLRSIEVYDPATGAFEPVGFLRSARFGHTATRLSDGRVLFTGGLEGSDDAEQGVFYRYLRSAEVYDPWSKTSEPTGTMTVARGGHSASLLSDGRVLLVGGEEGVWSDPSSGRLEITRLSWEIYDPKTSTFE